MRLTKLEKDKVVDSTYVKLARNKAHMGPVSEEKIAQARASALSAAANKVRVTAGFTVKVATDDKTEVKTNSQNQSFVFTELGDDSPKATAEHAVLLMQAWDNTFKDEGTPEYVDKLAKALEARATAYSKLGVNPASGDKPNLTADQRVVYNSIVGPTGFDYYEYHLAFKLAGQKKFVRSKTYRSLRPLDVKQMLTKLSSEVATLKGKITITSRQTN